MFTKTFYIINGRFDGFIPAVIIASFGISVIRGIKYLPGLILSQVFIHIIDRSEQLCP